MPKRAYRKGSAASLSIGIFLLVILKMYVFPGYETQLTEAPAPQQATVVIQTQPSAPIEKFGPPEKPVFSPPLELEMMAPLVPFKVYEKEMEAIEPAWIKNAVASDVSKDKPRVVVIIDDLGMDRKHTKAVMDLPGPLTLAFLPYAGDLKRQTAYGHDKGHELMVHVPMEPVKGTLDAGPSVLRPDMPDDEFDRVLKADLDSFDGYVGINNHMGSKMTQDSAGMQRVMRELGRRGLLFVDSRTIDTSVAAVEAKKYGVPFAVRDVFIDHEETYEAASNALQNIEEKALKNGLAIAIGHPKEKTIQALAAWLPTLKSKGIELVPISAAVTVSETANTRLP
jgi:polysaccharide deacetylase 2 family uncharacterized protein YibQ